MSIVYKVGEKFEVVLTNTKYVEKGREFTVLEVKEGGCYTVDGGYQLTVLNEHPMLDGIGVILKKVNVGNEES